MTRSRILIAATALLTGSLATVGQAHAEPRQAARASAYVPPPSADPFYAVPEEISSYRNGQVIRSRPITPHTWTIPLPATGWQLLYRTEDFRGRPTATVTTLLLPDSAWTGKGPRPLLSYQTAEDGVGSKCAPSYAFRTGLADAATASYDETALEASAIYHGWAVSVPDYEGPRSEFLVAGTEARGVLDGLRASRSFRPAHLSRHAPLGLWGYSGGSFASVTAAQLQPSYAPRLHLRAVALGGLVGSIRASINAFSGSIGGGAIPMGINGFRRAYPGLHLMQYLNASGRQKVRATSHDCLYTAAARYPFLSTRQIESRPNALDAKPVARILNHNSPLGRTGIPNASIYEYHATGDEFAPIGPARELLARFCQHGVAVDHVQFPIGEHISEVLVGAPGALQFLSNRFAGKTAPNTCGSLVP